ncbi:MAG: helix-turn-helix domain-containing protein [Planctomycetes bacterium]|nr:helix-turn-helix domain-containing protein [Planctomycetota bacterium]
MNSLLTPSELSKKLKVSKATVYRWTHEQYIPHIKIGRSVRFDEKAVEQWIEEKEQKGRSKLVPDMYL